MEFEPDLGAQRVPVTVVLGARGSGKTTLMNRILKDNSRGPWAVIQNEVGTSSPECQRLASIQGQMVPHAVGCLCCVGRSQLVDALRRFYAEDVHDTASASGRVLIETADNADPSPVMQTLLNNALVTQYYRLGAVVAVVEAGAQGASLIQRTHLLKQIAVADRIYISHRKETDPSIVQALRERLQRINPVAPVIAFDVEDRSRMDWPESGYHDLLSGGKSLSHWLALPDDGGDHTAEQELHAFALTLDHPLEWKVFQAWMDEGLKLNADVMYRVKGVLNLTQATGPVIIQGVQHVFQPPVQLASWPDADRRSRLTFVTREIDRLAIMESLKRDIPILAERVRDQNLRRMRALRDPSLPA